MSLSGPSRVGMVAGSEVGAPSVRTMWQPMPRLGLRRTMVMASAKAGPEAMRVAEVRTPAWWSSSMARLTPGVRPKSSALTMSCAGMRLRIRGRGGERAAGKTDAGPSTSLRFAQDGNDDAGRCARTEAESAAEETGTTRLFIGDGGGSNGSSLGGRHGCGATNRLGQLFQADGPELVSVGGEDGGGDDGGCHNWGQRRGWRGGAAIALRGEMRV